VQLNDNLKGIIAFLLGLGGVFFFATGRWIPGIVLLILAFIFIPEGWTPSKK